MSDTGAVPPARTPTPLVLCAEVRTTVDDLDAATRMARQVIEDRVGACAHVSAPITSWYWWEDEMQCTVEYEVVVRTTPDAADRVVSLLLAMHPYGLPALVVANPTVSSAYADWMVDNVVSARSPRPTEGA